MFRNCESVNVNKPRRSNFIGLAMFTHTNLQISSYNNIFVNVLLGRSSSPTWLRGRMDTYCWFCIGSLLFPWLLAPLNGLQGGFYKGYTSCVNVKL
jgi:hypothetical protein